MIPFPGESVLIEDAVDLTGGGEVYDLWGTLARRAGTRSMVSGTAWRMWAYQGDADYLEESGLSCDVSWVVEVASGTVTFTAGELLDPSYNDIASPTNPLGTYTATGPATIVIPSSFTADDVLSGGDSLLLELVGDSGSAEVQQVKLRVWPTGGALGGWSDPLPSWSTPPSFPSAYEVGLNVNPNELASSPEASWDATMAQGVVDWTAAAPGPHTFDGVTTGPGYLAPSHGGAMSAFHGSGDGGVTWGTFTSIVGAIVVVVGSNPDTTFPIDPDLEDGVDYVRPPTEVRGESGAYMVQQVGEGVTGWVNPYAYVQTGSEETPVEAPALDSEAIDDLTITSLGGGSFSIDLDADVGSPLPTPGPSGTASQSLSLPTGGQFIVVRLAHTAAATPPAWPAPGGLAGSSVGVVGFGAGTPGVDFEPMLTFSVLPPYRVWVPTVAVVTKLRQFHRDDGLGVTPPRAFGGASRIRTGRAYGYD